MRVVIYARYSSHSQTEQSIEGQLQVCYEYAKNNSYTVIGVKTPLKSEPLSSSSMVFLL